MTVDLGDFHDVPPLPQAVAGVLKAMEDPKVSAKDVTEMISHDVSISSKLLKVVNSAFYGYKGNITSVTQAVIMLGFNNVKSLVLGLSTCELLNKAKLVNGFSVKGFWRHSVAVGCASKVIAKSLLLRAEEEYFTYGLLHDVGKLVLAVVSPNAFRDVIILANAEKIPFFVAEQRLGHTLHTDIGASLFSLWKMPPTLVGIVRGHHNLDMFRNRQVVFIVGIADMLVKIIGEGDSGDGNIVDVDFEYLAEWLDKYDLNIQGIIDGIKEEMKLSSIFLELVEEEG